ncbi:uncharacterized protein LOC141664743 [Apium graveolens]|uniref:uncharacterized protein LOC141664743 n=1 Tax=Apium graveolens TaxID=4045 RepID=UPI003D7A7CF4
MAEVQQSKGWNVIWKLEIPHKIRVFLWRFCRNTLPVRNLLRGRGVPTPIICNMCTGEIEHLRNLFFECPFAKSWGQQVGINVVDWDIESSHDWLLKKLAQGSKMELINISQVLWGIWFLRNKSIFEGKTMTPEAIMGWSKKQIMDWQAANKRSPDTKNGNGNRHLNYRKWQPPEVESFKLNVDAAIVVGQDSFSMGMVIRNHLGQYAAKVMKKAGAFSVLEAELTGIIEALL